MGDVAHEDEQGWLYFDYRKGSGIRRNGDFINTAFIEKVIAESGLVDDVFVYGIPGASLAPGEKDVVAAVVPKQPPAFDAQRLYAVCRDRLESNFVPGFIQVLPQIPKTASEQPQERILLEACQARSADVQRCGNPIDALACDRQTGCNVT
jgi:carnitine-CoA ligase